jgi:hypothetical protein
MSWILINDDFAVEPVKWVRILPLQLDKNLRAPRKVCCMRVSRVHDLVSPDVATGKSYTSHLVMALHSLYHL